MYIQGAAPPLPPPGVSEGLARARGHNGLPTVFVGSGQGFDHEALAVVETVGQVLVSAGLEVLGPLGGICGGVCKESTQSGAVSGAFCHPQLLSLP